MLFIIVTIWSCLITNLIAPYIQASDIASGTYVSTLIDPKLSHCIHSLHMTVYNTGLPFATFTINGRKYQEFAPLLYEYKPTGVKKFNQQYSKCYWMDYRCDSPGVPWERLFGDCGLDYLPARDRPVICSPIISNNGQLDLYLSRHISSSNLIMSLSLKIQLSKSDENPGYVDRTRQSTSGGIEVAPPRKRLRIDDDRSVKDGVYQGLWVDGTSNIVVYIQTIDKRQLIRIDKVLDDKPSTIIPDAELAKADDYHLSGYFKIDAIPSMLIRRYGSSSPNSLEIIMKDDRKMVKLDLVDYGALYEFTKGSITGDTS